jgi:peptidoglycan/LPS O-acetylase OafA/YrhL
VNDEQQHYKSLDGLRGVAALSVVLLHYVMAFAPFLLGYVVTTRHTRFDHLVGTTPLHLPLAGNLAVCVFFVLSGFVLSVRFFETKDIETLVASAARRWFRLLIPAFGSVLLAYMVVRSGGMYAHRASLETQSTNWLAVFWDFPAHLGRAVPQGLYGIWFGTFNLVTTYNPVLWTMHYELLGSFFVFTFLALFGRGKNRWLFYGVLAIIFLKTYYLAFVAGMAVCDLFTTRPELREKLNPRLFWIGLPLSIVLGTWTTTVDTLYPTVYDHVSLPFFTTPQLEILAHVLAAIIMMLAVLRLKPAAKILSTRPFQYLGRVSFALYLTHFIVLGSLASYLFVQLLPRYGYIAAFGTTFVVGLPLSFLIASAYTRWVDVPAIALSKRLGNYLLEGNIFHDLRRRRLRAVRRGFGRAPNSAAETALAEQLTDAP